ncbi:C-type lectin 37Da [Drosophila yakuba]|uniref:C-type lectin domain-containing protein n=1 Tax=Drosophila yakuba TaxID=7245 RepID=A0A0R1DQE8_DROYA|nr:C-type lectin 37Da [Drosophila yakuba]KRJ97280.1 uncharacterized protein Dyak_GE27308 [Drosophila yakuba]
MIVKLTGSTSFLVTLLFSLCENVAAYDLHHKILAPFVKIGGGYYFIERNLQKNWFDAYESCRRLQAELITLETEDELRLVSKYLTQNNIFDRYWTSGTDLSEQGKHVWFSNGQPLSSQLWYSGEPNNKDKKEHCDELGNRIKDKPGMNDLDCNSKIGYICEIHSEEHCSHGH